MRNLLTLLFSTITFMANSQSKIDHLANQIILESYSSYNLVKDTVLESKAGVHYTYHQEIQGLKVYKSQFKLNFSKSGDLLSSSKNLFDESLISMNSLKGQNTWHSIDEIVYPAKIKRQSRNGYEVDVMEVNGEMIEFPLYSMHHASDSTISVMVFEPDPLSTAGVEYGGSYVDSDDSDLSILNNERVQRTVKATIYNGNYLLENEFLKLRDLSEPNNTVSVRQDSIFHYSRSQSGFEECNILYHITEMRKYIDSLGFDVLNYQIAIDAHALGGQDNSMFVSSTNPPRLLFGEGGVDDAEDVDVIIHEFGHALSESCAPYSNDGNERSAIDEALGDYLAASYSRKFTTHNWELVYSWDGHNEFWDGRMVVTNDHYPEDLASNYYDNADIWSSAVMEVNMAIGAEETDEILIQSMFSYHSNMTMIEAARYFVQADSLLNEGANYLTILDIMAPRGLMDWDTINSFENLTVIRVSQDQVSASLYNDFNETIQFELFDLSGRLIKSGSFDSGSTVDFDKKNFYQVVKLTKELGLIQSVTINSL